jgi:nuclear transport factor 2 (NTF2) superfamily protein
MNIVCHEAYIGWYAVDDDTYDGAEDSGWRARLIGHGATQKEAIQDFLDRLWEDGEDVDHLYQLYGLETPA